MNPYIICAVPERYSLVFLLSLRNTFHKQV